MTGHAPQILHSRVGGGRHWFTTAELRPLQIWPVAPNHFRAGRLLMQLLVALRTEHGAIERELVREDLVFRYRHADDFGVPANTFTMCSFWYVNALAAVGRQEEARRHFERLLTRCNGVGLLSEDIDPASGEQWGNFPQVYSMVGIITSALRLSRRWEDML